MITVTQLQLQKKNPPKELTEKGLAAAFSDFHKLLKKLENMDPQHEKIFINREECSWGIICYKQIYDGKKKPNKLA